MKIEESLAESLKEIGEMISTLTGAIQEMDQSLKVARRGAGIKRYDVSAIADNAKGLSDRFSMRLK